LISSSDAPADNNETTDMLVAPTDEAPPQAATAVSQPDRVARPDRPERSDRAHEANGLAAPLRAALRDRVNNRRDNGFELTVRLDPPELGAVRVRVFTQGDNVKITLHAENPEARAVLQERRDDVKALLRNEGFNLDGFDVETNDNRQHTSDQPNRRRANQTPAPMFDMAAEPQDDGALRL
jgi:flagellar hook-length control protein FliK